MEKITKTIETELYLSSDGRMTFRTPEECLRYEQDQVDYKLINNLISMKLKVPFMYEEGMLEETWYFIRNKDERDAVWRKWSSRFQYHYINDKSEAKSSEIKIGDWVCKRYDYDDGDKSLYGLVTLSYLLAKFSGFVSAVDKITVDGKY